MSSYTLYPKSIEPIEGFYGEEHIITINGLNLNNTKTVQLKLLNSNVYITLDILSKESTVLTAIVPSTLEPGDYELAMENILGQSSLYGLYYKCYFDMNIKIGEPVHINDMNYEDLIHYNIFCKLLSEGKYEEGYQYLVDNKVNFFNANFFNTFQDRLKKAQEYIDANKERITAYKDKPTEKTKNMIWISDEEDN